MSAISFLFSPSGRLKPQPFVYGALAVYVLGAASQFLTTSDILRQSGLLLFVAAQLALIWIWFCLHAKRLHDAGRSIGLAVGIALFYLLSVVLLLIVADGYLTTANAPLGQASAGSALLLLYIFSALAGAGQYDLTWVVIAIVVFMAVAPIALALGLTLWAASTSGAAEQ
jgi:uncharacterized membrane protein YhaH (DUF805 family)